MDPDYQKKFFTRTGSIIINGYVKRRPFRIEIIHRPSKALTDTQARSEILGWSDALKEHVMRFTGIERNILFDMVYNEGIGYVSVSGAPANEENAALFLFPTNPNRRTKK